MREEAGSKGWTRRAEGPETESRAAEIQGRIVIMSLAVGKIVRRLDKRILSVARPAKTPYSITSRLYCKTVKADGKNPHFKEAGGYIFSFVSPAAPSSPFNHKVSEWDRKLLMWSGRFKKEDDIPQHISAKTMSASRSKLRVKVAYFGMAILLIGFVSAVLIGKQDVKKYRSLRYMTTSVEQIEEAVESASAKP
ncbi:protein FAM162A isoform 1-T1 [Vipera latastei]